MKQQADLLVQMFDEYETKISINSIKDNSFKVVFGDKIIHGYYLSIINDYCKQTGLLNYIKFEDNELFIRFYKNKK